MPRRKYPSSTSKKYLEDCLAGWNLRFQDTTTLEEVDALLAETEKSEIPLVHFDIPNMKASLARDADGAGYTLSMHASVISGAEELLPPDSYRQSSDAGVREVFENVSIKKAELGEPNESYLSTAALHAVTEWRGYLLLWEELVNKDIAALNALVKTKAQESANHHREELEMLDRVSGTLSEILGQQTSNAHYIDLAGDPSEGPALL